MMYEYLELADKTLVTHSQIIEKDGQKTVQVHFERPKEGGFDSDEGIIAYYRVHSGRLFAYWDEKRVPHLYS